MFQINGNLDIYDANPKKIFASYKPVNIDVLIIGFSSS